MQDLTRLRERERTLFSLHRLEYDLKVIGLLQKLNRHALDLERAIDVEATSAKICVPTEIRGSKLYNYTIGKRTEAFQDRHSRIIQSDEIIDKKWSPELPDFSNTESWWGEAEESED